MKEFCRDLRKHATKIINCNKKEVIPLTKKKKKVTIAEKQIVTYVKKDLLIMKITMIKNISK